MSNVVIPTAANELAYSIRTTLTGFEYTFRFAFNQREGFWYFDLLDERGDPIAQSIKVVVGFPLLLGLTDARRPYGDIVAIDNTNKDRDPGQDDLSPPNARVSLVYLDSP